MNENKERFLGLLREVLTAGGALAFGAFDGLPSIIGLIVSIAAIGWALYHHEGGQIIATSIRKTLSLIPGVLLALNWVDPNTAASLASFLAPLFAIVWSYLDKDGVVKVPKGSGSALFALSASLALIELLPSCGMPVTVGVQSEQYGIGGTYSPKGGLSVDVDADRLIDRESGK